MISASEIKVIQISELSCWDDFCVVLAEDVDKIGGGGGYESKKVYSHESGQFKIIVSWK